MQQRPHQSSGYPDGSPVQKTGSIFVARLGAVCRTFGPSRLKRVVLFAFILLIGLGCHKQGSRKKLSPPCPSEQIAAFPLPGIDAEQQKVEYWLSRMPKEINPLFTEQARVDRNQSLLEAADDFSMFDLQQLKINAALQPRITRRLTYIGKEMQKGQLISKSAAFDLEEHLLSDSSQTFYTTVDRPTPIFCTPNDKALYKANDPYALNRNLCSTARKDELIAWQPWKEGWALSFSEYTFGFTPETYLKNRKGKAPQSSEAHGTLSRESFLRAAFSFLGQPYGWGGQNGGLDCSRFIKESFAKVGVRMPRHSSAQLKACSTIIEIPEDAPLSNRLNLIEEAHHQGIALLQLPGHIMLYLGHNDQGIPVVLHAFMDYKDRCKGSTKETRHKVAKVALSSLYLGDNSAQGSLLRRITAIGILGQPNDD
ncbi:MAG: C40 family peptidase [Myxococcales bacterium]|nr:MAG: C40 family peptidase [Myxococcales bacterium]